jgi:hypothetical protein
MRQGTVFFRPTQPGSRWDHTQGSRYIASHHPLRRALSQGSTPARKGLLQLTKYERISEIKSASLQNEGSAVLDNMSSTFRPATEDQERRFTQLPKTETTSFRSS